MILFSFFVISILPSKKISTLSDDSHSSDRYFDDSLFFALIPCLHRDPRFSGRKKRLRPPVIARNRTHRIATGRSSDSRFITAAHLPGYPVIYRALLLFYSGGTVRDFHPFPYYPAENFTGTSCVILLYCTRKRLRLSNTFDDVRSRLCQPFTFMPYTNVSPAQQLFQFFCIFHICAVGHKSMGRQPAAHIHQDRLS